MIRSTLLAAAMGAAVSFLPLAAAQTLRASPIPELHAINPSISLSARPSSPLEQQIQQSYRTTLMAAQRERLQESPSGLSRQQIAIGQQLDDYDLTPSR